MATSELQKLSLGYEVKGLVLSHLLSARQGKETMDVNSRAGHVEKTASDVEAPHVA
ncbi:hypothetical protein A2U01_0115879, partial [Trifolium medium]|nr:hypothetical protein [Trifolium medium]